MIGIWDDHDYGKNNGDASNPVKIEQKQMCLDYLDEPKESERRWRGDDNGIWDDYEIKLSNDFSIRVILLDVRFHKSKYELLGEAQLQWLENIFKTSNNTVYLIGSGI